MHHRREYIWCLVELMDGRQEWYCISRVLREALFFEKKINPYWKNTLIGCYLNVARSKYHHGEARLTVGKVRKIRIYHRRPKDWHWTRNQFVTADHLEDFKDAYHYLKHNYAWYNAFAIWQALLYWHFALRQKDLQQTRKHLNQVRGKYFYK